MKKILNVAALFVIVLCANDEMTGDKMKENHLNMEKSPYLREHVDNPVDWYPWGNEAIQKAKKEDKPIFLSIGYSSCHWCHVMERESFENNEIADILNEYFISIKVDREERPDMDDIYMKAVQAMTGSGGWPLNVFLTPDLKPFYGGTYFPPDNRYGGSSFKEILLAIEMAWKKERTKIEEQGRNVFTEVEKPLMDRVDKRGNIKLENAVSMILKDYDEVNGGFGSAPKFPSETAISFLLKEGIINKDYEAEKSAINTLRKMAEGGLYDQIGGGFFRYSVDAAFEVPHYEKMLYNNSLLSTLYLNAYKITKDHFFLDVAEETLNFMIREMSLDDGGFATALDADSEGAEGKFYLFSDEDLSKALSRNHIAFARMFYSLGRGNPPNRKKALSDIASAFNLPIKEAESLGIEIRRILFSCREKRIKPKIDDKVLLDMNALALSAFCSAYSVTGKKIYLDRAVLIGNILNDNENHVITGGRPVKAGLSDLAYGSEGLLKLYEITGNKNFIERAGYFLRKIEENFLHDNGKIFLNLPSEIPVRGIDEYLDSPLPSPAAVAILSAMKMDVLLNREQPKKWRSASDNLLSSLKLPTAQESALEVPLLLKHGFTTIELVGKPDELLNNIKKHYIPFALFTPGKSNNKNEKNGLIICKDKICHPPVYTEAQLSKILK